MTHPTEETLNDYIERELGPAEHVRIATHLESCGECALVVAEIQQVVRDASALGPLAPPPHVWSLIQDRLDTTFAAVESPGSRVGSRESRVESPESRVGSPESRVGSPESRVGSPESRVGSRESRVESPESRVGSPESRVEKPESRVESREFRVKSRESRVDQRWTRFAWAAATAALVVMAFFTGRFVHQRDQQSASPRTAADVGRASTPDALVRERVLLIAVGDHLERSQMVLVELAHAETRGNLDISAERQLADDLVASNRLYRQTAQQMGQASVAGLLDELERVLVEVARGPSTVSMRQLADIQQRIESQGILFKVKVFGSDIRQQPVS